MEIQTRHTPAFGIARIALAPNEAVRVESGAMAYMAPSVLLESKMEGGLFKSLKRAALGGESFFLTTYTANQHGGWVDVAPRLPGDLLPLDITPSQPWVISKGSWIASAQTVTLDTKWGGFKNLFGSEGGFAVHASGDGKCLVACYGALERWTLAPGETITVDTGHMVAYEASVGMNLRKVTGGLVQTMKSGEGIVFDFTGPGVVLTQTRNPNELATWISSMIGTSNSGATGGVAGLGAIGGLLSRD
jgi:uncharacterized protein (TIGR00266 family)